MPSSISSSELPLDGLRDAGVAFEALRPGYVRLTASDRPGIAQPVPERDIPPQPWRRIVLGALAVFVVALGAWEGYWRAYGAEPGYRNSDAAWAEQRRRINSGEGDRTVLVGDSRILFDVQLPAWEAATGERPIQLALEGSSAVPFLEDLANDPDFTGRVVVGVAPDLFFSGFTYRERALRNYRKQSPSQRAGHWLSRHFVEPVFAFYDGDFALPAVLDRQPWPLRDGRSLRMDVRKLMVQERDRNTYMWQKVETDAGYRDLARSVWANHFNGPPPPTMDTPEKAQQLFDEQVARAAKAVATLRARGVPVVFVRFPSDGEYYAFEQKALPRAATWDRLVQRTGVPGIHFEDYPQLQGYELPEWSHLSRAEADRFTRALVPLAQEALARQANAQVANAAGTR